MTAFSLEIFGELGDLSEGDGLTFFSAIPGKQAS